MLSGNMHLHNIDTCNHLVEVLVVTVPTPGLVEIVAPSGRYLTGLTAWWTRNSRICSAAPYGFTTTLTR